ncbi:hypothetical protein HQ544_04190 [Candidatus Falkowbacteria bacterium]|nr:hypothetical protein [Candidatus Falkowbacteria bacterium]
MAGSFQKSYDSFSEGLAELMEVSSSVRQSLTHERGDGHPLDGNLFEGMQKGQSGWGVLAIAKLASNASHYLECELEVALYKGGRQRVAYTTAGGLGFGWTTYFDGPVCFFLRHPDGDGIHKDSTLRQAALTAGWKEVRF